MSNHRTKAGAMASLAARSDDKKRARLNIITHLLGQVPYEPLQRKKVVLPQRKIREVPSKSDVTPRFIPTPF
jgi:hypothetical protein